MPIFEKFNNTIHEIKNKFIKIDGTIKEINKQYINVNGTSKLVFCKNIKASYYISNNEFDGTINNVELDKPQFVIRHDTITYAGDNTEYIVTFRLFIENYKSKEDTSILKFKISTEKYLESDLDVNQEYLFYMDYNSPVLNMDLNVNNGVSYNFSGKNKNNYYNMKTEKIESCIREFQIKERTSNDIDMAFIFHIQPKISNIITLELLSIDDKNFE